MEFVKEHGSHRRERRIIENHPCENALSDHFDFCARADFRTKPHPISHSIAHGLAKCCCHTRRRAARGETPWFENNNFFVLTPGRIE